MSIDEFELDHLDLKNFTILVIDDNPANLGVVVQYLEEAKFQVLLAQNGESGLERAEYALPDLILLDVLLPGINGFEVSRRLRSNLKTQNIPVIFMTALSDVRDKIKGFEAGGVDYIIKPIEQAELLARISTHLRLKVLAQRLRQQNQQLRAAVTATEAAYRELERIASLDGLTQVANRRSFDEHLEREWQYAARDQKSLSLILFDIDYFKPYNDYYGHPAGDECLKQIAQAANRIVRRPADLVARYGGEEFAVILPDASPAAALHITKQIQQEIRNLAIPHACSQVGAHVTLSLGVSSQVIHPEVEATSLVSQADQSLYIAKNQGRDRYHISS